MNITILYKVRVTLAEVSNYDLNFLSTTISIASSVIRLQTFTTRHGFS